MTNPMTVEELLRAIAKSRERVHVMLAQARAILDAAAVTAEERDQAAELVDRLTALWAQLEQADLEVNSHGIH